MQEKLKKLGFEFRIENNQIILKNTHTNIEYKFNTLDQVEYFLNGFESCSTPFAKIESAVNLQSAYYAGTPIGHWEYFVMLGGQKVTVYNIPHSSSYYPLIYYGGHCGYYTGSVTAGVVSICGTPQPGWGK